MPRDLQAEKQATSESLPELTRSPDNLENFDGQGQTFQQMAQQHAKRDELHPYVQTLNLSDAESCVVLENEAFPPHERATREKFQYRLKRCGELSMGIFTSHEDNQIVTSEAAAPVYSGTPKRKAVLLGHVIGTMTTNLTVKDEDMALPSGDDDDSKLGHKQNGRTLCIHSLAVLPEYQGRGLGKTLIQAYVQRMESQVVADRVALIAHDQLIPYYEKLGFVNQGKSECEFGGGGWYDMVRELRVSEESLV